MGLDEAHVSPLFGIYYYVCTSINAYVVWAAQDASRYSIQYPVC